MSIVLNGAPPETYLSPADVEVKPQFPGIPTTSDGAGMVVWVENHITPGACAYPITSSTTMGGGYQAQVAHSTRNPLGEEVAFIETRYGHNATSNLARVSGSSGHGFHL